MHRAARARLRRRLLASTVWVVAALSALPAAAASDAVAEAIAVDLPAGPLDASLTALATQTRQQVLYTADLVADRTAPALKGAYTPDEALSRLLAGSGIVARRTGPDVLVLQSAPPARRQPAEGSAASRPFGDDAAVAVATADPIAAAPPTTLGEVTVTGSNIRGAPPAAPLRTFTQSQLQDSGQATLVDALRALPENFAGGASEGNSLAGGDGLSRNITYGSALNLRGLGNNATLVLLNGRRVAGSGSFADFVDVSMIPTTAVERVEILLDGASAVYGLNNTILDNCHVYTAFSALDPLTQDKVSKLTGLVSEIRLGRSRPAGLSAGRSSISLSEVERPLLEPGEIRSLPDDAQLVFVAGQRPLRTRKVRYDRRAPFRARAAAPPPDPGAAPDTPAIPPHPWAGRRALGENPRAQLPLFKEAAAMIDDKKAAARVAQIYQQSAEGIAAQEAILDQLQGGGHAPAR
ncbi:MAG: TonB-dependent receptor plug domain-containing protein [Phenylobacterium sp.]|uniref:TonB-dependent receptor plug domain-containing protein n=1 Tax=Phenylobacterium sp. TaxID=1871053 RepID=UPI0025E4A68F|nr:TonB-dependent receptor plug domain-containing protein [Phenylobacterium sp.]MBI1197919.1 TonB-dependent receptor plug domain-containing protein [Phenylobacterium sp.]